MGEIESVTRKWGKSSLVFVIPKEIVEKEKLKPDQKVKVILVKRNNVLARTFGIAKNWKRQTEEIMRKIDKELWEEK